jgi:hypothetical protein
MRAKSATYYVLVPGYRPNKSLKHFDKEYLNPNEVESHQTKENTKLPKSFKARGSLRTKLED